MRKKRFLSCLTAIIAIAVLFSLSACSPVEYQNIEKIDSSIAEDSAEIDAAENDGRSLTIKFHPVAGARSYAVTIDGYLDKEPIYCYGDSVRTIKSADEEIYKRLIK